MFTSYSSCSVCLLRVALLLYCITKGGEVDSGRINQYDTISSGCEGPDCVSFFEKRGNSNHNWNEITATTTEQPSVPATSTFPVPRTSSSATSPSTFSFPSSVPSPLISTSTSSVTLSTSSSSSSSSSSPLSSSSPSSSSTTSSTSATIEPIPEPLFECDRKITGDHGRFTSPDYPAKATGFLRCRVTITTSPGFVPVIVFPEFEFLGSNDCLSGNAYVQINAIKDHPDQICGSQKPFSVTADGNVVVVQMVGTPGAFHWFSASFYSISMVNVHFVLYEELVGRFDASLLNPSEVAGAREVILLHSQPGSRIFVSFEDVDTGVDVPVRIEDVVTEQVIAELYGSHEDFSISSEGNELLIAYQWRVPFELVFEYEIFVFEEQPFSECDVTLTRQLGVVQSPGYPIAYPPNVDCIVTIRVEVDQVIRLVFMNFSVGTEYGVYDPSDGTEGQCFNDYMQVTDVTSDLVRRFCGLLYPFAWTSGSNELMITLHTDERHSSQGFKAEYRAIKNMEACMIHEGNELYFQAPSDDRLTPCTRLISTYPSTIIVIEIYRFNTPAHEDCIGHGIMIQDVITERNDVFCGSLKPFTWTSDTNEVLISLPPIPYIDGMEFRARYQVLPLPTKFHYHEGCKYTITESTGEINIPEVPTWPPRGNGNCLILFHAPPGHRIQLSVKDLVIDVVQRSLKERDGDVEYKQMLMEETGGGVNLQVYDVSIGIKTTGKTMELTENQPDFTWTSETNEVIILTQQRALDTATIQFRVEYATEPQILYESFMAAPCGYIIDRLPGIASRMDMPPSQCKLVFRVSPMDRVLLNIISFNVRLEPTPNDDDCKTAYVEFADVLTGRSERICSFQPNLGFSWLSEGNELSVLFQGAGLFIQVNVSYRAIPRPAQSPYQSFLVGSSGEFSSLIHVSDIFQTRECEITLHVRSSERLNLRFCQFLVGDVLTSHDHMRHGIDCQDKYVQVRDLYTGRTDRYCGQSDLFSWTSDANVVQVSFRTIPGEHFRGFKTIYKALERYIAEVVTLVNAPYWRWAFEPFNASGIIGSPNFPDVYSPNSKMQYILHAEPGNSIVLVTSIFDLDFQEGCIGDSLEIVDLGSGRFLRTCDYHGPFTWTSDSNEVKVTFRSNAYDEGKGFAIEYQSVAPAVQCVNTVELNASHAFMEIQTDDVTRDIIQKGAYSHLGSCLFVVQATPDFRIRMNVADLKPSSFESGLFQIAEVISSRVFTFEISDPLPWSFTSEGNALYVLINAHQEVLPSLKLTVHALLGPSPPGCQRIIENPTQNATLRYMGSDSMDVFDGFGLEGSAESGARLNPGMDSEDLSGFVPGLGPSQTRDCHVLVRLQPSMRLTVVFSLFEESGYDCAANVANPTIEVEDATSLRLDDYCGSQQPFSWTSDANDVLIRYHRYEINQSIRVLASFNVFERPRESDKTCSKVLMDPTLVIESVNFPRPYSDNLNCQVVIHAPPDKRIQLVFTTFRLEGIAGSECNNDYLEISDLTTGRKDRACGILRYYAFTSDSNEVLMRFVTDSSAHKRGYQTEYIFQDRPAIGLVNNNCNATYIQEEGTISSPNILFGEATYDKTTYCQHLIHASPSYIIMIVFDLFDLEKTRVCKKDYVEIVDIAVGTSERFCGFRDSLQFTSQGNELEIIFHTSETNERRGFRATYKLIEYSIISDCDNTFTTSPEIFTSPKYSDVISANIQYMNNLDCTYTFVAATMEIVEIIFMTFELEDSEDCVYDYVEVQTVGLDVTQRYCGVLSQFVWISAGNTAILRFHSDHIIAGRGFQAEYTTTAVEPPQECDISLTSTSGSFTSPGYPEDYPNNRDCKYSITVEPGNLINITFTQFQLELHRKCDYDYIQIYNEPSGLSTARYCGPRAPYSFLSETNQVLVEFHSDSSVRFRGFVANFSIVPVTVAGTSKPVLAPLCEDQSFQYPHGFLTSPNFPYKYHNDENCRIDIVLDNQMARVRVTFHFIDIEEHHDCKWDFVQLTDNISHRQSDRLCGTITDPLMWESDSNDVTITFQSDDMVTRTGFYATYESVPGNEFATPPPRVSS